MNAVRAAVTAIAVLSLPACNGPEGTHNVATLPADTPSQVSPSDKETSEVERLSAAIAEADPSELLEAVVPEAADLPEGFSVVERSYKANPAAAQSNALESPADALARFLQNGRVLSLEIEYQPPDLGARLASEDGGLIALQISATLYETPEGSLAAFDYVAENIESYRSHFTDALQRSPNFVGVRPTEPKTPSMGDGSFSIGFAADLSQGLTAVPVVYDVIGFRRGPFVGVVLTGSTLASAQSDAQRLVQIMIERMDNEVQELSR